MLDDGCDIVRTCTKFKELMMCNFKLKAFKYYFLIR